MKKIQHVLCDFQFTTGTYVKSACMFALLLMLNIAVHAQVTVTNFSPAAGCGGGTPVVITGTNFTGATIVTFGGVNAQTFLVNSPTQITATPALGNTGTISVTSPFGTGTSAGIFTVNPPPAAPSPVTATPSTICAGSVSNLNATSAGNVIGWFTVPSGGVAIGNSPSGVNFPVTPAVTTTYYAEAQSGAIGGGNALAPGPVAQGPVVLPYVPGGTPMGVVWNPQFSLYYGVTGGNPTFPVITYDAAGAVLNTVNTNYDVRGSWWNPNTNQYEYNGYASSGYTDNILNASGWVMGAGVNAPVGQFQPDPQSMGGYDPTNNETVFYNAGQIERRDRTTGALVASGAITGLPAGNINTYWAAYSDVPGSEIMIYDYTNQAVRFIDRLTFAYSASVQLAPTAPQPANYSVGYDGNGNLWLHDGVQWVSYQIINIGAGGAATQIFNYTGATQTFTVPAGVTSITIDAKGAQGGTFAPADGGLGARMKGDFAVTPGQVLTVWVGQQGIPSQNSGGGGGGSGVIDGATPLVIAGGGGGGATMNGTEPGQPGLTTTSGGNSSGAGGIAGDGGQKGYVAGDCGWAGGGGGFLTDGTGGDGTWDGGPLPGIVGGPAAGKSAANGGAGGIGGGCGFSALGSGGWGCGGGGRGEYGGGGGGGYSGGGAGQYVAPVLSQAGGGGGSFNSGLNQQNTAGFQSGNGQVVITWSAIPPCVSVRVPVTVTVNPAPAVTATASPAIICPGGSSVLSGGGALTYSWNPGALVGSPTVTPPVTTTYTVTGIDALGCTATSSVTVTVTGAPVITATANPPSVCLGGSTVLTATGGATYVWNPGGLVGSPTVTPAVTTTYTVTGTVGGGCTGTTVLTVVVNPVAIAPNPVTATPSTICQGNTTQLNSTSAPGDIQYWYTVPSGGVTIGSSLSGANFPVSPAVTTTYYVENGGPVGPGGTQTFSFTGAVQNFTVPAGVTSLTIEAFGAEGIGMNGFIPGKGGKAQGTLSVTPGQVLDIWVGGSNAFNGGGLGLGGAHGGGASDVRVSPYTINDRVIAAGGGGGAGGDNWQCFVGTGDGGGGIAVGANFVGGAGGAGYTSGTGCGTDGGNAGGIGGSGMHGGGGGGGGLISGGTGAVANGFPAMTGALAQGGDSYNAPGCSNTGAGGGGYYGGGGAAGTNCGAGRGGGGSSWTGNLTSPSFVPGVQAGNGQIIITWAGAASCPSSRVPVTVTVTPAPAVTATASPAAICAGSSAVLNGGGAILYQWNPGALVGNPTVSPAVTTTYTLVGTDANGCTASSTVTLTVSPYPVITATASPATICAGASSTLNANGAQSYIWDPGALAGNPVVVTPATTTTYTVTGTVAGGCTGTTVVTVNVNPVQLAPNVVTATPNIICVGGTSQLNSTSSPNDIQYWFTVPSGGVSIGNSLSGANFGVSPAVTTTYYVENGGVGAPSCPSVRVPVTVTVAPAVPVLATATPASICIGETSVLTASGAVTYVWNPGGLPGSPVNVSPAVTTTYTVTGTNAGGCTATSVVTVIISAMPTITAVASPSILCLGDSSVLSASGAGSYTWNPGGLAGSPTVAPLVNTIYTVTGAVAGGCSATATVAVIVNGPPAVTANASPATICIGGSTVLTGSGAGIYTWNPGGMVGNPVTVSPVVTTTYTVTGSVAGGCTATSVITVTVNPALNVTATATPPTICVGASSVLTGGGAATYNWNPGGLAGNPTVSPVATTTYTVTGSSGAGCSGTSVVMVTVVTLNPVIVNAGGVLSVSGGPYTTYQWFLNGSPIAGANNATYNVLQNGTYLVEVTLNGCSRKSASIVLNGVGIDDVDLNLYSISPNPTSDKVTISGVTPALIKVLNMQGQVVKELKHSNEVSLSQLSNGMYFIQLFDEKGRLLFREKITKQ